MSNVERLLQESLSISRTLEIYQTAFPKQAAEMKDWNGNEEMQSALRAYWRQHISDIELTEEELCDVQMKLQTARFSDQYRAELYTQEYKKALSDYIKEVRDIVSQLMTKQKKQPQRSYGSSAQSSITEADVLVKTPSSFNDILKEAENNPNALSEMLDEYGLAKNIAAKRYLFACELKAVLIGDSLVKDKILSFSNLLSKNKSIFDDSALRKLLIYTAIFIAGLATLGMGGFLVHRFFSNRNKSRLSVNDKKIAEAVCVAEARNEKIEDEKGMYNFVQGALWDVLEDRHRWYKLFVQAEEANDPVDRVTEIYDTACMSVRNKHKDQTEISSEEIFKELKNLLTKELSKENLTQDDRYHTFSHAVDKWLPNLSADAKDQEKLYKCAIVQRTMLIVLDELKNPDVREDVSLLSARPKL